MATASGEHPVSALEPSLPFVLYPPSRGGCSGRHPCPTGRRGTAAEVVVAPRVRVLGSCGSWSCSAARSVDRVAGSALRRKRLR